MLKPVFPLLLLALGCHPKQSMSDSLDVYKLNSDHKPFGVVDPAALGQPGTIDVKTPVSYAGHVELHEILLHGVVDDKLCFATMIETNAVDSASEVATEIRKIYESGHYQYLYYHSLDEITSSTPWPAYATTQPFTVDIGHVDRVSGDCYYRDGEKRCYQDHRAVPVRFCGAVPKAPADAKFFGLAVVFDAKGSYRNYLALWKLGT